MRKSKRINSIVLRRRRGKGREENTFEAFRALVDNYRKNLKICDRTSDGPATEYVTTALWSSRRMEITNPNRDWRAFRLVDFGTPNPNSCFGAGESRGSFQLQCAGVPTDQFLYRLMKETSV